MPFRTVHENLLVHPTGLLVHGCNAQGAMGAGFAQRLVQRYPAVLRDYKRAYHDRGLHLGQCIVTPITPELVVVSAITQEYYGRDPERVYSSEAAIAQAFDQVNYLALEWCPQRPEVSFPAIGCGLANGSWPRIERVIRRALVPQIHATLFLYP